VSKTEQRADKYAYDATTVVLDLKNAISEREGVEINRIRIIHKGKILNDSDFVHIYGGTGNFFICHVANVDQKKKIMVAPLPLPVAEPVKNDLSETERNLLILQLQEYGYSEKKSMSLLEESDWDLNVALRNGEIKKNEKHQKSIEIIEELRNELFENPNKLEDIIHDVEINDPEKGMEMRNNPEKFLREIKMDPALFPIERIKRGATKGTNDDIDFLMSLGFPKDYVLEIYEVCECDVDKAANCLLGK